LSLQWIAGFISSFTLVSGVWDSEILYSDYRIQAAIFVGGAVVVPAVLLAVFYPGRMMTRYVVAIGQAVMSALLVQATENRTESYFHLFGSLAFLSFYRDWRLLITASALAFGGDLLGPILFNSENQSGFISLRCLELAGWIIFEDAFLIA